VLYHKMGRLAVLYHKMGRLAVLYHKMGRGWLCGILRNGEAGSVLYVSLRPLP